MAGQRPARGTYAKTARRREEILRVATDVFAANGYNASSYREIAAQVGLSVNGLSHHFGNKAALLTAVLQHRQESDAQKFRESDSLEMHMDRVRDLIAYNATRPGLVELFAKMSAEGIDPSHPAHSFVAEHHRFVRELTVADIRRLQEAGSLDAELDAELAAVVIYAVMDGLQLLWMYDRSVDMVAAFDLLIDSWAAKSSPAAHESTAGSVRPEGPRP